MWEQLLWRVRTCSLAIAPARVTPAGSGGAWHRQDRRLCGQGRGGEKKREREKKSGRTHPLTGKGVVREVANSTEEFRPFLGKPQPSPDTLLAAPSRGQLPRWGRRGAQWVPPGAEPAQPPASQEGWIRQRLQPRGQPRWGSPARTGTDGSFSAIAWARWRWNNPLAKEAALPRVTGRICPQAAPRSSVTSRGHFRATVLSATLCFRCPRASSTARRAQAPAARWAVRERGCAEGGLSQSRRRCLPAASSVRGGMCQPDAQSAALLPRPRVTHKQSCLVFFPLQEKKKQKREREREKSAANLRSLD